VKCALITGATGVVGSELAPLFLQADPWKVRLIVRARSPAHLSERFEALLAYWGISPTDDRVARNVEAYAGDVCQPKLGLQDADYERLSKEVTHVIHCAGNVRLNQSLDDARRDAVGSARQIVQFARACQQRGSLRKVDVLSTIGVAGRMPGLIPERRLTEPREYHNTYEAAKAEAEEFLFGELDRGLPLTIHRPSMVVGNSQTGRIRRFQVFYHLCDFLSGNKTIGLILDTGNAVLDIVPVDYVARALYIASGQSDSIGKVFHLCSGPENAVRLTDLADRLQATTVASGCRHRRTRRLSSRSFRLLLWCATRLSVGKTRRELRTLPYFLSYLDESQSFNTTVATHYFAEHHCTLCRPTTYLDRVVTFYRGADCSRLRESLSRKLTGGGAR
jgi:thioester reductase-like protein